MYSLHNSLRRFSRQELALFGAPLLVLVAFGVATVVQQSKQKTHKATPVGTRAPARRTPRPYLSHASKVTALAVSPNGKLVASAGLGEVMIWSVQKQKLRRLLTFATPRFPTSAKKPIPIKVGVLALAFSPDSKLLALGGNFYTYTPTTSRNGRPTVQATISGMVEIHDVTSGKLLRTMRTYRPVHSVAFAANGQHLASGEGQYGQGVVRLWQVETGKEIWIMPRSNEWSSNYARTADHKDGAEVHSIAFSRDGKRLASIGSFYGQSSGSCGVRIWNPSTGKLIRRFSDGEQGHAINSMEHYALAFSSDGRTIAINRLGTTLNRRGITLLDAQTGNEKRQIELPGSVINAVAFSPDGRTVVGGDIKGLVQFCDVNTGQTKRKSDFTGAITCLTFLPDGKTTVIGTEGSYPGFWGELKILATSP